MKATKRIASLLLALVMVFAMSATAFAEEEESSGSCSITIDGAVDGETYTAYKLFDVTYNNSGDYSYYTTDSTLKALLEGLGLTFTEATDGTTTYYYVNQETTTDSTTNTSEVVFVTSTTVNGTTTSGTMTAAELATKLNNYLTGLASGTTNALGTGTTGTGTTSGTGDDATYTYTISGLTEGYYFVDSSLGALCALDTVKNGNTAVTIYEKNSDPSIKKEVQEDDDESWNDSAVLDVIDTVNYKLTVNTGTNSNGSGTGVDANYVITDTLPAGFSYVTSGENNDVYVTITTGEGTNAVTWEKGTDYTESYDSKKGVLTVTLLSTGKLATLAQDTDITITYSATMAADKVTYGTTGNTNTATLKYKEQEDEDTAKVYTYEIGGTGGTFKKVDNNNSALEGVEFQLTKTVGSGESATTYYAQVDSSGYLTGWTTTSSDASAIKTDSSGYISVKGLDAGTYILTETKALDGYNKLSDTITVEITKDGSVTYKLTNSTAEATNTITVVNNSGSLLPSTGGAGTTLFYIIGGVLVVGAAILLITKKRMSAEK